MSNKLFRIDQKTFLKLLFYGVGAVAGGPLAGYIGSICSNIAIGTDDQPGLFSKLLNNEKFQDSISGIFGNLFAGKLQSGDELPISGFNHDFRKALAQALIQCLEWNEKNPGPLQKDLTEKKLCDPANPTDHLRQIIIHWQKRIKDAADDADIKKLEALFPSAKKDGDLIGFVDDEGLPSDATHQMWEAFYNAALKLSPEDENNLQFLRCNPTELKNHVIAALSSAFPAQFAEVIKKSEYKNSWIAFQRTTILATRQSIASLNERMNQRFDALEKRLDELLDPSALLSWGNSLAKLMSGIQVTANGILCNTEDIKRIVNEHTRLLNDIKQNINQQIGGISFNRLQHPQPPKNELDLLKAKYQEITLVGRDSDMESLIAWLEGDGISARLLVGPAGTGKTRLAFEFLRQVYVRFPEWKAGIVNHQDLRNHSKPFNDFVWNNPTLLVIDYAQPLANQLTLLFEALAFKKNGSFPPLRILLLERVAEPWFDPLLKTESSAAPCMVRDLFNPPEPIKLTDIPVGDARQKLFQQVLEKAARLAKRDQLPKLPDKHELETLLAQPHFVNPLHLIMSALASTELGVSAAMTRSRMDLAFTIAEKEQARIERFTDNDSHKTILRHLAACATMERGFSSKKIGDAVEQELKVLKREWAEGPGDLEEVLMRALPGEGNLCVSPVQPDFVGEALVLKLLAGPYPERASSPQCWDRWCEVVERCCRRDSISATATLIHILQNFAEEPGSGSKQEPTKYLERILIAIHELIKKGISDTELDLLLGIESALPEQSTVLLQEAVDVTKAIYERLKQSDKKGTLARFANNLSICLSNAGQKDAALPVAQEAVDIYCALAQANPQAYRPVLALSLNTLALCLSELGQKEAALPVAQEAVDIYCALAQANPQAYRPDLALSLNNLAKALSELGQKEAALPVAQEAVDIRRALAQVSQAYRPALALSLNNLANFLSALGQKEAALPVAQEAVDIYCALAQANPQAYRPDLALSLNNLATILSALGQKEAALPVAQEAVDIYRALAQANPQAYRPDLAMSLNNLALCLSDLEQKEAALPVAQEAVDIYRALAQANPQAYRPDLAMSLNNLAKALSELGQNETALPVAQEPVDIYRALAQANPQAYRPNLATSLNNLANRLSDLGQREVALPLAQEAVDIYRALAQTNPQAYRPGLAMSLNNLALRLSDLEQREAALPIAQEAVDIYRALAQTNPQAYRPDLAMSLNNLALRLSDLRQREAALPVAQEPVDIYRALAQANPQAYRPNLATSLNNLANRLSDLEQREAALPIAQEAVDIYRALAQTNPQAYRPDLAMSLNNLALRLSDLRQREAALPIAQEAVDIYRALAQANPQAYQPDLARSLNNLALCLSDLGQSEAALPIAQEAVDIRRSLALANPQAYRPALARSLGILGFIWETNRENRQAFDCFGEGLRVLLPLLIQLPAAFGSLARALVSNYTRIAEANGYEMDEKLLKAVAKGLGDKAPPIDLNIPPTA